MTYRSLTEIIAGIEKSAATPTTLIKSGFPIIDKLYYGIAPSEVWTVGAYSGTGKSFFLIQLALNVLRQAKKVVYFSLEMSSEALAARLWGNIANVESTQLEFGMLKPDQFERKVLAKNELVTYGENLYIVDNLYSLDEMSQAVREIKPDIVLVDYIQNIQASGKSTEYERLSSAIVELQKLGKETAASIVVASQLSNDQASNVDSAIFSLKGSGGIYAASDFVISLSEDKEITKFENEKIITFGVRKARRGAQRKLYLKMTFPGGQIIESKQR